MFCALEDTRTRLEACFEHEQPSRFAVHTLWLQLPFCCMRLPAVANPLLVLARRCEPQATGDIRCDHWHEGTGFLVHHLALSVSFEQALQAVDAKVGPRKVACLPGFLLKLSFS